MGTRRAADVLGRRALNRALLERQLLLRRAELSVLDALEHLAGLQAQAPYAPYVGLWSRLAGFRTDDLVAAIEGREAVRIALMRSTIHLVSARDCLWMRPLVQSVTERGFLGAYGRWVEGVDRAELAAAGRALLEERPCTSREVGTQLLERWPDSTADALGNAVRCYLPLVQVPPRGIWGKGGVAAHTTAEAWLGRELDPRPSPDALVTRYLAAFGPASVNDVQTWSGLGRLREVVERLRPGLRAFRDENGVELFDLPDAPRPDPDTPAPVRFVPEYDNLLLSHADRTRVIAPEHREPLFTKGGFLVDGFLAGAWKRDRGTLHVEPFVRLARADRTEVEEEGRRLLGFAAGDAAGDVRFGSAAA